MTIASANAIHKCPFRPGRRRIRKAGVATLAVDLNFIELESSLEIRSSPTSTGSRGGREDESSRPCPRASRQQRERDTIVTSAIANRTLLCAKQSREMPMRAPEKIETWVVYQAVQGDQSGIRSVCTQSEWPVIEARKPGVNQLIREGITSETEAELLARGTSGDVKKRASRRNNDSGGGAEQTDPA